MNEIVLKTQNLSKKYKDFVALDNVCINIQRGDIYELIRKKWSRKDNSNESYNNTF